MLSGQWGVVSSLWGRSAGIVHPDSGFSVLFFPIQFVRKRKAFQGNTECLKEK